MKVGEGLGQNRHCPGVNGCMVALRESTDSLKDAGVEVVSGLEDKLIAKVGSGVVVVVVVVVVAPSISVMS